MKLLFFTTFLLLLSCNSESQNNPQTSVGDVADEQGLEMEPETSVDDSFSFPQLQLVNSNCADIKELEICDWGLAAHDIVLLEVTGTSLIFSPSVDGETQALVTSCEGSLAAGFRIEGTINKSVNGLSGKIAVDVGAYQYSDFWDIRPLGEDDSGSMEWSGPGGIEAGDVIGLTLHKHPTEETLGILGEPFFDVKQNDAIRFGVQNGECVAPNIKAAGLTFDKLKEEIKQCRTSTLSDKRKQAKEETWKDPAYANLGACD